MALSTPNVNIVTDSFQNWIDKTNTLLDAYSTTIVTTAASSQGGRTTGNATVNGIFTANSLTVEGNTTFGLRGGNSSISNVLYITSNVSIGNTSVNTVFTTTTIDTDLALNVLGATALSNSLSVAGNTALTGNATLSGTLQTIAGNTNFDSGVLFVDAANNRVGINNTAPGVALRVTGAADISLTANVQGDANVGGAFGVAGNTTLTGNATLNGTLQTIAGNVNIDSGVLFVDATNDRVGINNTAPGVALRVTGATDISLTANIQGAANVGGALGVAGNTTLTGNAVLSGTLQTIAGNTNFDSGVLFVDATNNRVGINNTAPGVALEVTGAANISTSVNSALLTVGTSFIANTTGAFHTGTINAASFSTTGLLANTTAVVPTSNTILLGNSIGRFVISANTGNFSDALTVSGTSTLTGNTTLNGTLQTIAGNVNFDTGTLFVDATNNRVGINNTAPGVALVVTGAANISTSVNSAVLTVGTSFIANTTGAFHTGTINAASFSTTGLLANTTAIVPTSNTILLGNSIGRFVISANSGNFSDALTVSGTSTLTGNTTLNGTLQTIAGNVNFDTGTLFVDATNNRVGINNTAPGVALEVTGAANVSTSVNSALLTVGTSFIANTTGAFHTGTINAASFSTTGLLANTTAVVPTSNTILLGNSIGRFVLSANSGNFSGNMVVSGTANVSQSLNVTGNVTINTFATFLTLANTDLGSDTTANVTAVSFPKANHQAGELLIYLSKGSEHQITKILFAHNGTDVNQTIYGTIVAPSSSSPLANNIIMTVNSTNIDVNLRQRVANSSVKILTNMII